MGISYFSNRLTATVSTSMAVPHLTLNGQKCYNSYLPHVLCFLSSNPPPVLEDLAHIQDFSDFDLQGHSVKVPQNKFTHFKWVRKSHYCIMIR